MRKYLFLAVTLLVVNTAFGQDIPQHISYTRLYDFIDELANDGFIAFSDQIVGNCHIDRFALLASGKSQGLGCGSEIATSIGSTAGR